jgi:hypothetical protein
MRTLSYKSTGLPVKCNAGLAFQALRFFNGFILPADAATRKQNGKAAG